VTAASGRLSVAVVGAGIGASHVRGYQAVADRFEVVAMCDVNADRARRVADEHGVTREVTDMADVCRMDDVDVVDVCTPYLHFEHILQANDAN
jgi:predicted dehydrogenase